MHPVAHLSPFQSLYIPGSYRYANANVQNATQTIGPPPIYSPTYSPFLERNQMNLNTLDNPPMYQPDIYVPIQHLIAIPRPPPSYNRLPAKVIFPILHTQAIMRNIRQSPSRMPETSQAHGQNLQNVTEINAQHTPWPLVPSGGVQAPRLSGTQPSSSTHINQYHNHVSDNQEMKLQLLWKEQFVIILLNQYHHRNYQKLSTLKKFIDHHHQGHYLIFQEIIQNTVALFMRI